MDMNLGELYYRKCYTCATSNFSCGLKSYEKPCQAVREPPKSSVVSGMKFLDAFALPDTVCCSSWRPEDKLQVAHV